jgi:hypothetical protein
MPEPELPEVPEAPEPPGCFGPYLRYAIRANFRNFDLFDDPKFKLLLLVKFKDHTASDGFLNGMKEHEVKVEFGPASERALHVSVRAEKAAVASNTFRVWRHFVEIVELSLPLRPTDFVPFSRRRAPDERWNMDGEPAARVLIGVIDDGCPFAAAQFLNRSPGAAASTRVRAVWDQNQWDYQTDWDGTKDPRLPIQFVDASGNHEFGRLLTDFKYGVEFWRATDPTGVLVGLNDWIGLHTTNGNIDEDGCYAEGGFYTLKHRASHGAHVMDVLAGALPPSSRVGPPPDYLDPPSFTAVSETASSTDLVFVQFPEEGIRDATGVWLKTYVVDAINYILSFADPQYTKDVIINLSYGPTTGPHNGTAELEQALNEFVQIYDGDSLPRLQIFLPDGNAYLSDGHVAHRRETGDPDNVSWKWRIPPDNSVLCFAEVWMKTSELRSTTDVILTTPSGSIRFTGATGTGTVITPGAPFPPFTGVSKPLQWGNDTMWLLAIEPTLATSNVAPAPEHGDWTVKVDGLKRGARVHAYVARSDPNMGATTGARRSYFVDPAWESGYGAAAGCTYVHGNFSNSGSLISREGTLNGIATDDIASIQVAGGFMLANGRKSPYASAGPSRMASRLGPDLALFCDQSYALQGVRAGGNRSGVAFRLIGTSAAAPQLARWISRLTPLPPLTNGPDYPERGRGNLKPP